MDIPPVRLKILVIFTPKLEKVISKVFVQRTPTMLTEIIKRCWAADPRERPSFKDIVAQLEKRR
jgi:hypothetical protein